MPFRGDFTRACLVDNFFQFGPHSSYIPHNVHMVRYIQELFDTITLVIHHCLLEIVIYVFAVVLVPLKICLDNKGLCADVSTSIQQHSYCA